MTIKDVKLLYQAYDYFFLTTDSDNPIEGALDALKEYGYDSVMKKKKIKPVIG